MTRDEYTLLGSVVKIRGISGEVIIRTRIDLQKIHRSQETLMINMDGLPVPFFIDSWQQVPGNEIIVKFHDLDNKDKAARILNRDVYLLKKEIRKAGHISEITDLAGFKVVDNKLGQIGTVTGILDIPGNALLKVKHLKREILLPLQEGVIMEINSSEKLIRTELPEGLLEI